jgi:formamidopyrimidine-DNA glycosylase
MPELPEVETVVRSLRPHVVGQKVRDVYLSGLPLRMARKLDEKELRRTCVGAAANTFLSISPLGAAFSCIWA